MDNLCQVKSAVRVREVDPVNSERHVEPALGCRRRKNRRDKRQRRTEFSKTMNYRFSCSLANHSGCPQSERTASVKVEQVLYGGSQDKNNR